MRNASIIKLLDDCAKQEAGRTITATSQELMNVMTARLDCAEGILARAKARIALERDETAYAVGAVIKRLDKLFVRSKDAVTRDQIRLASRQLRRLVEPEPEPETKYTEPIDIFCV